MKKITLIALLAIPLIVSAQETPQLAQRWTEDDRKYLLENLIRSRDELLKETQDLSKKTMVF